MITMNMKDNSYRCPWCGCFVKKASKYNLLTRRRECPFCAHNYCCKLDQTLIIIIPMIILFSLVKVNYYWLFLTLLLIDTICQYIPLITTPMVRCQNTIMPEKGYKVEIEMYGNQNKTQLRDDTVIPIVFISDDNIPKSSLCCFRIENGKWSKEKFVCELRLLAYGISPQSETAQIYLYNKGQIIAYGKILKELGLSY